MILEEILSEGFLSKIKEKKQNTENQIEKAIKDFKSITDWWENPKSIKPSQEHYLDLLGLFINNDSFYNHCLKKCKSFKFTNLNDIAGLWGNDHETSYRKTLYKYFGDDIIYLLTCNDFGEILFSKNSKCFIYIDHQQIKKINYNKGSLYYNGKEYKYDEEYIKKIKELSKDYKFKI